jgi:hypothetical protein
MEWDKKIPLDRLGRLDNRMPRKARLDAPGTLHHVIIRGIERSPIVDDDKDRENFVSRLGHLVSETGNRAEILLYTADSPR